MHDIRRENVEVASSKKNSDFTRKRKELAVQYNISDGLTDQNY